MILIGLGANLPSVLGPPRRTLEAALAEMGERGIAIVAVSRWYESAPVPVSEQPWYVNAVAGVETILDPAALLACLNDIEQSFGRIRVARNAARVIDLDLLAYHDLTQLGPPQVPHPRLNDRAFVLLPLREIAPNWRDPMTGENVDALIDRLPDHQDTRVCTENSSVSRE